MKRKSDQSEIRNAEGNLLVSVFCGRENCQNPAEIIMEDDSLLCEEHAKEIEDQE